MSYLAKNISNKIIFFKKKEVPFVLGIDGPTASGKTTLADNIKENLIQKNKKVFIFRLDWTLKSRKIRENSLQSYKNYGKNFYYEAEDHMNLQMVEEFLQNLERLKNQTKINITLKNLYNRNGSAKNDLNVSVSLDRDSIIILEGHYTGYASINKFLDLNILLLGNYDELLKRKIQRVKSYRSSKETKKYFDLIDVPSFTNFLTRFGCNYQIIYDNTDYNHPVTKDYSYLATWVNKNFSLEKHEIKNIKFKDLYNVSDIGFISLKNIIDKKYFYQLLSLFYSLDIVNSKYSKEKSIYLLIKDFISKINKKNNKILSLSFSNIFHNSISTSRNISLGFSIKNKNQNVFLLFNEMQNHMELRFFWKGGCENFILEKKRRKIYNKATYYKENLKLFKYNKNFFYYYLPTDYTYINFVDKKFNVKKILTSLEETNTSSLSILNTFYENNRILIHRYSKFEERNFFREILNLMGAKTAVINNYLFALKTQEKEINKKFDKFFDEWNLDKQEDKNLIKNNQNKYDKKIDLERENLDRYINKLVFFKCIDGNIFLKKKPNSFLDTKILKKEIKNLLINENRSVRKSISNFVNIYYPESFFETSRIWPGEKVISKKISLNEFFSISPTIMSDIYFWSNLRSQNNAVLAANVYDIRENSLDISSFLKVAQDNNVPLIIQTSFNAIGQKDRFKDKTYEGYLKIQNAQIEYQKSVLSAARNIYLKKNKDFLFGIGLDHIDYRYNFPSKRIFNFLGKFGKLNNITHYTLDSSVVLEDSKILDFKKDKKKLFKKLISNEIKLIKKIHNNFIYDYEFVANELNYIENQKKVYQPSTEDIIYFAKETFFQLYKNNLGYLNVRPKLFVGNLGTTHHSTDIDRNIDTTKSIDWVQKVKRYNFISAVLHGTSRSHPSVLQKATVGCHKINVAGDFLQVFVSSLPRDLKNIVKDKNDNEKRKLYLIREKLNFLIKKEKRKIYNNLYNKCNKLVKLVNSPTLSKNDISYFKHKSYVCSKIQAEYFSEEIVHYIINQKKIKKNLRKKKTEFLLSPIEIPYGNFFKKLIDLFTKLNQNVFHIDVGDGKFISRKILVENKINFIKKLNPKNKIHLHLMVYEPHKINLIKGKNIIDYYSNFNVDKIGIHRRSFKNIDDMQDAINLIKRNGSIPGIFVEVDEEVTHDLFELIKKNEINWIVFMGVPTGYGGQFFHKKIFSKIINIQKLLLEFNLKCEIEVDGGLTKDIVKKLKDYQINYLSGWSIIKSDNISKIKKNLKDLNLLISN